jgi:hypothetical protein
MTSIHWGGFAEPNVDKGYPDDWRCEEGGDINDEFGVNSNPSILINREQTAAIAPGQWRVELDNNEPSTADPSLKLHLLTIRDGSKNENKIVIRGIALKDIDGDHTIGLMLVTDSVIAPQMLRDRTKDPDYAHRHMLRGAVGPTKGNAFIAGNLSKGDTIIKEYNFQPNPTWDTTHLSIHAFVRNSDNANIIQAETVRVTK